MRVALTGASGNIGSAVLRRLAETGGYDVVGLVRRPPEPTEPPWDTASWVALDLADPGSAGVLEGVLRGVDAVVHLAWGFQPSHDLTYLEELGVGGTRRVLQAVRAAGVGHLVHLSSVGAYSPRADDEPVDETWPTGGVPSSPYSRHKAAAERLLDAHEAGPDPAVVTRLRPGFVGQTTAGSALLRYGLPAIVPAGLLRHLPVLPLDRRLRVPLVHADDVADAVERSLSRGAPGAFNLAAAPVITAHDVADALDARLVHVPSWTLRGAAAAAWAARLQPVDPGWVDLAFAVPSIDTTRARRDLGWATTHDAHAVLLDLVEGLAGAHADSSPALRPRTVARQLVDAARRGAVTARRRP